MDERSVSGWGWNTQEIYQQYSYKQKLIDEKLLIALFLNKYQAILEHILSKTEEVPVV